jgi:hypothetical protein
MHSRATKLDRPVEPKRYHKQTLCTLATVKSRLIDSRQQRQIFTQGGEGGSPTRSRENFTSPLPHGEGFY